MYVANVPRVASASERRSATTRSCRLIDPGFVAEIRCVICGTARDMRGSHSQSMGAFSTESQTMLLLRKTPEQPANSREGEENREKAEEEKGKRHRCRRRADGAKMGSKRRPLYYSNDGSWKKGAAKKVRCRAAEAARRRQAAAAATAAYVKDLDACIRGLMAFTGHAPRRFRCMV